MWLLCCMQSDTEHLSSHLPCILRRCSTCVRLVQAHDEFCLQYNSPVLLFQLGFTLGNVVGMYLAQNYDVSGHIHVFVGSLSLFHSYFSLSRWSLPTSINKVHKYEFLVLWEVFLLLGKIIEVSEACMSPHHHKRIVDVGSKCGSCKEDSLGEGDLHQPYSRDEAWKTACHNKMGILKGVWERQGIVFSSVLKVLVWEKDSHR